MEAYSTLGWFALALFAVLSAFGAAAQEAITPINQARLQRLEDEGMQRAKAIEKLLEQSEVYASTLLLFNILSVVGATAAAATVALLGFAASPFAVAVLAVLLVLGLLVCQMLGKTLALRDPRLTARLMEGPLLLVNAVLSPVAGTAQALIGRLWRAASVRDGGRATLLNEEALYLLVGGGGEEENPEESEHAMIHRIIEFEDKTAHEIMVPRIDIVAVPAESTLVEVVELVKELGYSRIPVYEGSIDNIVGVLYAKDILAHLQRGETQTTARELARSAYFVPESKHVDELLHDLRQSRVHIAIVVDEYGGTAGLVTIEDLLEEIVGEIRDEYDQEEERIQVLGEGEAVFDAGVSVDDVNRTVGAELETNGYDTLGGLVYHVLGKMPKAGDTFVVNGLQMTVLSTEGRRIGKVRVEPAAAAEADEAYARGDVSARSG